MINPDRITLTELLVFEGETPTKAMQKAFEYFTQHPAVQYEMNGIDLIFDEDAALWLAVIEGDYINDLSIQDVRQRQMKEDAERVEK